MYNTCNDQKTFLSTIDNQNGVGYNTDRWNEQTNVACKFMCSDTFFCNCTAHVAGLLHRGSFFRSVRTGLT